MNNRIIALFFIFVFFIFVVFAAFLFFAIAKPKSYFNPIIKIKQDAIRGSIYTKDYTIAKSEKLFGVYVYPKYIDPNKKELFFKLFSIYTDIPVRELKKTFYSQKKSRIKLATVNLKTKQNLIYLRKVLDKKRVFLAGENDIRIGYDIESLKFKRVYPYKDTLEPFLGRYRSDLSKGENGLEYYYQNYLGAKRDGYKMGYRDVYGNIIYDNSSKIVSPINGNDLELNINLVLQKKIEKLLDIQKEKFNSKEVLAAVMDSKTGKIIAIATSNRYNPLKVTKKDIKNMKISAIRDVFEPGSVMKPITFAILLEKNRVNPYETINAENGVWKVPWRKQPIVDDEKFDYLTAENAIVHSSNIVVSKLALRLSGKELYDGLKKFGFATKTGIDLPFEVWGNLNTPKKLNYPVFKTSTAFGYNIDVTFVQLLKAYNVFNNDGVAITPKLANVYASKKRVILAKNARIVREILRKVVLYGTGKKANIKGLYVAGKTGTARYYSYKLKKYIPGTYNTSFFGFVDDGVHSYTIGVTCLKVKLPFPYYFASQTAVPTFKQIVDIMVGENLIKERDGE